MRVGENGAQDRLWHLSQYSERERAAARGCIAILMKHVLQAQIDEGSNPGRCA